MESAEQHTDSWWPDFVAWLGERGGEKKDAPQSLGGAGMAAVGTRSRHLCAGPLTIARGLV